MFTVSASENNFNQYPQNGRISAAPVIPPEILDQSGIISDQGIADAYGSGAVNSNASFAAASFRQGASEAAIAAWGKISGIKGNIDTVLENVNFARQQSGEEPLTSFNQLLQDPSYADTVKGLMSATGLSPESLSQVSQMDTNLISQKISQEQVRMAQEISVQKGQVAITTAWLESSREDKPLAQGPNA
jgi:hypothetical protein